MVVRTAKDLFQREVSPGERLFIQSPFSVVTLAARISGTLTEARLRVALDKVQQRHRNLQVRLEPLASGGFGFTTEDVEPFFVKVMERETDLEWVDVSEAAAKSPFEFDRCPPIKFYLLTSDQVSDLVIACHHVFCDGLSLSYLLGDILTCLGDPAVELPALPDAKPIGLEQLPDKIDLPGIAKFFVKRINNQWLENPVYFDQEDYRMVHAAYWENFKHRMVTANLSAAETSALVEKCREEGVTVNSALSAAIVGAQAEVLGAERFNAKIAVAGNLRERLKDPVGKQMGFYAGVVTLNFPYKLGQGVWENARAFHKKAVRMYTDKALLNDFLAWSYLQPGILEAINFKKLGSLVGQDGERAAKLNAYSQEEDVVYSILKRDNLHQLDQVMMGTAVTNLTRLELAEQYGDLTLERVYFKPGGAFPLSNINMLLGVVTCCGKLSMAAEFEENVISQAEGEKILELATGCLLLSS